MSKLAPAQAWHTLSCIEGLGPKRLRAIHRTLTEAGRQIGDVFDLEAEEFQRLLPALAGTFYPRISAAASNQAEREYQALKSDGVEIVHLGHACYPESLLTRLGDSAPPLLYCRGALPLLTSDGVAIVGSRHAAQNSVDFAAEMAGELTAHGQNVISGYAAGIDTAAHLGALRAEGTTTIVLSASIREFAPKRDFVAHFRGTGILVVSQFPPATRWSARNAMARNKLVCALARAVLVVEAGRERDEQGRMSGTFDAGKTALELGVPLFVLDPASFDAAPPGNVELLKRGGKPVHQEDALEHLLRAKGLAPKPVDEPRPLPLF